MHTSNNFRGAAIRAPAYADPTAQRGQIGEVVMRNKLGALIAVLFVFTFAGRSAADTIADDFNDGVLDILLWQTVTTNSDPLNNIKNGSVAEAGGVVTLTNRGALNTVLEFEPSPSNPVTISLDFSFVSGGDLLQISTRTAGD